jgi:hypothetical protein
MDRLAYMFYRVLRSVTEIDILVDTDDFRLIDRKVCDQLVYMKERSRFVRGKLARPPADGGRIGESRGW